MRSKKPTINPSALIHHKSGSGKTFFGIHAVEIFSNEYGALQESLRRLEWTEDEITEYKNMRLAFMDLPKDLLKGSGFNMTFRTAFYMSLYKKATQKEFPLGCSYTEETMMDKIADATGHKGKFFIFVDEIGSLEKLKYQCPDLLNPQGDISQYNDEYRALFHVLLPLLKHPNVVCFCAGKSGRLTERALEDSQCLVRSALLMLNPFEKNNIQDIIERNIYNDRYLKDHLPTT